MGPTLKDGNGHIASGRSCLHQDEPDAIQLGGISHQLCMQLLIEMVDSQLLDKSTLDIIEGSSMIWQPLEDNTFLQKLLQLQRQCSQVRHEDGQLVAQTKEAAESADVLQELGSRLWQSDVSATGKHLLAVDDEASQLDGGANLKFLVGQDETIVRTALEDHTQLCLQIHHISAFDE